MVLPRRVHLCLLLALLLTSTGAGQARHAPLDDAAATGTVWEIDRRSHPGLAHGWDALTGLAGVQILFSDRDRALLWLSPEQEQSLRNDGVRLNRLGTRSVKAPRVLSNPGMPADPRSLTLLQSLSYAVNIDSMMVYLDYLSTDLQTRYYSTTGMQAATQYVLEHFVASGLDDVYFDTFTYNGHSIRNVIGVKTGSVYPNRIYMICGHLDSTSPQGQTLAPGAEDNGSGSVGVLEAARLLAGLTTESTIYFVCFTAEEQGLIGSSHLAQIADQENWDLRGVLNMDMIGYDRQGAPDLWIEGFPSNPASVALMNQLETIAETYTDMSVYRYPSNGWGSDHVPFNDHGFPALLAIDYDWDNYSCYHQTCDVIANIVPAQFRRMAVAVTVLGAQIGGLQGALGSVNGVADRTDSGDDEGIQVIVVGTGYPPTSSGPGGTFSLPDLLPGTYTLRATAYGYQAGEAWVHIRAGQATQVTIPLDPLQPAAVSGLVSLQGGGDPSGARIFAEDQAPYALAGPAGEYLLSPVDPGQVILSANYEGTMPGVVIMDVPSGQEITGVNFTLKTVWDFETSFEGLTANAGWAWGSDAQSGAHSGSNVWGTRLGANYENCADYRLDLPPLDLRFYQSVRLHFWHWYKTEATYDGGNVQVSTDAGATWSVAVPDGGYPDNLRGACNPLAGQAGYGGAGASWREAVVDLSAYAGRSIRLRFWFGSDGGARDRGWYIDDLSLDGTLQPTGIEADPPGASRILYNLSIIPNPTVRSTSIRFDLGTTAPVSLAVFDAAGRRVCLLADDLVLSQGPHLLSWDGRDDRSNPAASGTYWVKFFAMGERRSKSFTLLR